MFVVPQAPHVRLLDCALPTLEKVFFFLAPGCTPPSKCALKTWSNRSKSKFKCVGVLQISVLRLIAIGSLF